MMADDTGARENEERLIHGTMLSKIDQGKSIRLVLKNLLRYPRLKGKIGELEPNVYFGYTDHPLDVNGTAMTLPFTFFRKNRGRTASSVLSVEFREQYGNSFIFRARGYDVFRVINRDTMNRHEYLVDAGTKCRELTLRIDFLKEDAYRVRLAPGAAVPDNVTPMVCNDIADGKFRTELREEDGKYILATKKLRLEIVKIDFRVEIFDAKGRLVTETGGRTKNEFPTPFDAFPLGFIRDRKSGHTYGTESFMLYPGEAVYGLGEQFRTVNRVGQTVGLWNFEGLGNTSGRTYKNVPFFMSTRGYGVFVNESAPMTFWVGSREFCRNELAVEGELIDYYFFYGPSFKSVLNAYTDLTGKPAMPPRWSFGTWMSRISYFSQEQVAAVMRKLRAMRFPADVIHIDTGWFEKDWRCDWEFDAARFPDPRAMFREAHDAGFRVCLWQIPYVLDETRAYFDARKKNALASNNGPFAFLYMYAAHAIDFSRPEGVAWYREKLAPLLEMGADSIKTDFAEQVEPPMKFARYDGRRMHNLFPLLYQEAAFDVIKKIKGEKNAVVWSRSAWAGAQRYPVHWSGDNSSNHENLLCSLRGGLSLGMCGFTFWSQDTGGFVGVPSEEVYIRWVQLSIFQSHMRFHGNPPHYKEPWNFSSRTQDVVRGWLELRYRLIPYICSESREAARGGLPLLRHLVIEFQDDPAVFNIEDQFMCGRHLLVAPILEKNDARNLYLPRGIWYDFFTGEKIFGGRYIHRATSGIPVFMRAGAVVPLARPALCTDELSLDELTLKICPDESGNASYTLEDDGKRVTMDAKSRKGTMDLRIRPEPRVLRLEMPAGLGIVRTMINGKAISGKSGKRGKHLFVAEMRVR